MNYLLLSLLFLLSACAQAPKIIAHKGAVFGTVSTEAHIEFKQKIANKNTAETNYSTDENGIEHHPDRVNYQHLDELYVGLIVPDYTSQTHNITVSSDQLNPHSLALSIGDTLHITNQNTSTQYLFISEINAEGFQAIPDLKAGQSIDVRLTLEGDLELLSEDNHKLKSILFSKKNMLTKKFSSGQRYQFENLTPNHYQLIFWYWRLGKITQTIKIDAQKNTRVDKTLSVNILH